MLNQTQRGKFYFSRAFFTTMGILISWTTWGLIPAFLLILLFGIGRGADSVLPDNEVAAEPTSQITEEPSSESSEPGSTINDCDITKQDC